MTEKKKQIINELERLQNFINHCESAREYGLGLDEETYKKYTDAMERQKELGEQLKVLDLNKNGIITSAMLMRKESSIEIDKCKVETIVELSYSEFQDFKNHLFDNRPFIEDNIDYMYRDNEGINHCLLVLGEGEEDGILVESEGYSYARYTALLPNAQSYIQKNIQTMAEDLIKQGTAQTANGSWVIGFDEISQHFDTTITPTNGIGQMLIKELETRDEVAEIIATEDCIEMTYYLDHAPVTDDAGERLSNMIEMMGCNIEDTSSDDEDEEEDEENSLSENNDDETEDFSSLTMSM